MNNLFYENDKDGFIKNILENDTINQKKLSPFFNSIINIFTKYLEKNLLSIFINYKKYKDNTFKVKIIALINNHINISKEFQNDFNNLRKNFEIVQKCNLFFNTKEEINNNYNILFDLKVNFICIYGEDIKKEIQKFKPTIENINFHFQKLIYIFYNLEKIKIDEQIIIDISKTTLGACYELCIDKEKKYSKNIEFFYKTFSKYYPDKEIFAKYLFQFSNNKNINIDTFNKIISIFGKWLLLQYDKIIIEKKLLNN